MGALMGRATSALPEIDPEAVLAILGAWETAKLDHLTQKAIRRLTSLKAAGLFSEYTYSTVWGEYSHHMQNGYFEEFSDILDDMAADACEAVAETVPAHEMQLFDRLALARGEDPGMSGIPYVVERLKDTLASRASVRNLERYADDYRWFENL